MEATTLVATLKATLVAVGSEMVTPFRVDTNSLHVTERLNAIGYGVESKVVVADDRAAIVRVLRAAVGTVDLIVCTGGLGPTEDDLTREALAELLGAPLEVDEAILDGIRARFAKRGLEMPVINRRQAMVPRGASVVPNTFGTAPGLWAEAEGTQIALLPGPPREMAPMLDALIASRIRSGPGGGLFRRVLKVTGRTESDVDAVAEPIYGPWSRAHPPISTTILAVLGQIELHLTVPAASRLEADQKLDPAIEALRQALGDAVYSVDGRGLEQVVGDLLAARHVTIAVAESCTGGLLASRLTDVPGSSSYFDRGMVCYSNEAKITLLGVSRETLAQHGAVSEPVAHEMAAGVRDRAGTTIGVGVTGIAGPGGATDTKPVGTVAIAVVAPDERLNRTFRFAGPREQIKYQAAQAALNLVRLLLLGRAAR